MPELTIEEMRKYIKERWKLHFANFDWSWMPPKFHIRIAIPDDASSSPTPGISFVRESENECIKAAYAFTFAREEEIGTAEEDANNIQRLVTIHKNFPIEARKVEAQSYERIHARERSHLDRLRNGWCGK